MSSKSELIQQLRAAVPVATLSECVGALKEARNDLDGALALLAQVQQEADADKRDRMKALSDQGLLFQFLSLAQEDPGGTWEPHEGWLDDLTERTCSHCLSDILSDRFKSEPWTLYCRIQEFSKAAQHFDIGMGLDTEAEGTIDRLRRRSATQLLMAMIVEHKGASEATGRVSWDDGDTVRQIRIFRDPQEDPPSAADLLEAGADPNSVYGKNTGAYNAGKSALVRVIENLGDEALARRLLEHGADPLFTCGVKGDGTPAHNYTVLRSCYITASETVGAGTYARTTREVHRMRAQMPMMSLGFVRLLIEHGVDPNIQNHRGGPLHYAASLDLPDHVLCLLEAGADPRGSFQTGGMGEMTALHLARGHETTRLLLEWGADPRVTDDGGLTAAESARTHGGRDEKLRALEEWSEGFSPLFTVEIGDKGRGNRHLVRLETKAVDGSGGPLTRVDLDKGIRAALDRLSFPDERLPSHPVEPGDETE